MSLLEWMMTKVPFYGRILQDEEDELGDYNPLIITKLLKNYRSHPSILEVRSISEIRTGAYKCIIIVQYIITTSFIGKRTVSMKVKPNPDNIYDYHNYYLVWTKKLMKLNVKFFQLPNEMFYDDELEPSADKLKRESLCNWSRLPCKGFPIIFDGIKGRDMREEKSPSFFNPEEAAVVLQYVKDLKDARGINVLPSQIGIISPYRKQVQ